MAAAAAEVMGEVAAAAAEGTLAGARGAAAEGTLAGAWGAAAERTPAGAWPAAAVQYMAVAAEVTLAVAVVAAVRPIMGAEVAAAAAVAWVCGSEAAGGAVEVTEAAGNGTRSCSIGSTSRVKSGRFRLDVRASSASRALTASHSSSGRLRQLERRASEIMLKAKAKKTGRTGSSGLVEDVSWIVGGAQRLAVGLRPSLSAKMKQVWL